MRRLAVAVVILATGLAACASAGSTDPGPTQAGPVQTLPVAGNNQSAGPPASSQPGAAPSFNAFTLRGKGKKVVKFKIPEDQPALATSTYGGRGNFSVTSIAKDGTQNDLLVNVIGKYKGTVLFDESSDEHSVAFEVDAEAAWTIVVKPIEQARAWNPTTVLKGTGDDVLRVSPPSAGLVTLQLTHSGRSNFAVQSYSLDGDSDLLVNEIGKFKGEVLLPDQTALLTVEADGAWTGTPGS